MAAVVRQCIGDNMSACGCLCLMTFSRIRSTAQFLLLIPTILYRGFTEGPNTTYLQPATVYYNIIIILPPPPTHYLHVVD